MIYNIDQFMDWLLVIGEERIMKNNDISNKAEMLKFCKEKIHYNIINNAKIKKQFPTDIIWTDDFDELVFRYKTLIKKFSLTLSDLITFKINNLLNWLFDGNQTLEIPPDFILYKNDIKNILWFLHNNFLNNLQIIKLLNETVNGLFNNDSEFEIIKFYKFIIQQQKIQRRDIRSLFPQKTYRKEFIQKLTKTKKYDTGTSEALFYLITSGVIKTPYSIKELCDESYIEKENMEILNDKELTENINNEILRVREEQKKNKLFNNDKIILNIDQKVIDDLELTIFDVKTIKEKNLVLFIFIDKYNKKRYYYQSFEFTFFVSKYDKIIENDYIVDFNPSVHFPYTISNFQILTKFKFLLNDVYKKYMMKKFN